MPLNLPSPQHGDVFWVTGLAGAGKTTLAGLLVQNLRIEGRKVVFLDGDVMREVLGGHSGHSAVERRLLAGQYAAMCRMISCQGVSVVCATISMFHDVRRWNREKITRYCEIYLRVPLSVLVERDQKGLYGKALAGEISDVIGINAPFEEPECPDIILDNDGSGSPEAMCSELLKKIKNWSEE